MMKQLRQMAMTQRTKLYALVLLALLTGAVIILQAYFIVSVVDRVFLQGHSFEGVLPLVAGLFAVLLARVLFFYWSGRTGIRMAAKVKKDSRQALLHQYIQNQVLTSLKGQSGEKVSVMMEAVDELDSYFSKYYPQMMHTFVVPLMILIVVFTLHVYSGLIILLTAPFIPLFMIIIGGLTQKKSEEQLEQMSAFSGRFLDTLQGLTTLKLFGRSKEQKEGIRQSTLGFRQATMSVLKIAFSSALMLEFISMLSIGLVALELGLRLVVFEQVSFFTAFFILLLVPEFYVSLKDLGSAFHAGRGSMAASRKIGQELESTDQAVRWGTAKMNEAPPHIQLKGVEFHYGENSFSLQPIDTDIPPNAQIAIVGKSGSGKSTLLHLLAGLIHPSAGEICVNDRARSAYQEREWFDRVSYISQHPYLFAGTIEENIALGMKRKVLREDIEQAAQKAGIAQMIDSLELGYQTRIGEGGRGLSGGEKQRIALARAFLKRPSIILFDEPTTGLDLYTEQILQASMVELAQSSTVITVAHRLHTIRNADNILFLDQGLLVAQGTHAQLLASVEEYHDMVTLQQRKVHE